MEYSGVPEDEENTEFCREPELIDPNPLTLSEDHITLQTSTQWPSLSNMLRLCAKFACMVLLAPVALLAFFGFLLYLSISWILLDRKVSMRFSYIQDDFNQALHKCILHSAGFYTPPWWYNIHLGSLVEFGGPLQLELDREILSPSDGAQFAVDWYPCRPHQNTKSDQGHVVIALFNPGLGLSSQSKVAQILCQTMIDEGKADFCGVINPRGHPDGVPLVAGKQWHAGLTEDTELLLEQLYHKAAGWAARGWAAREAEITPSDLEFGNGVPRTQAMAKVKVVMCGFSAGANIVTSTLNKLKKKSEQKGSDNNEIDFFNPEGCLYIAGAMLCCINYHYSDTCRHLESSCIGSIYSYLLAHQYKHSIFLPNKHLHQDMEGGGPLSDGVRRASSLSEFDSAVCKFHGFSGVDEMCHGMSTKHYIENVPVPLLVVNAVDDPLYKYSYGSLDKGVNIPHYISSGKVVLVQPSHGNHFGFISGSLFGACSNRESYRYPALLANAFIATLADFQPLDPIACASQEPNYGEGLKDLQKQSTVDIVEYPE
jgi:predicted alpha/beta-fold hydrolase